MVEVAERNPLLALMRRVRRRWRWTAALEGGAVALTAGTAGVAIALFVAGRNVSMTFALRLTERQVPVAWVACAVGLVVVAGAMARARGKISLNACARAVDRAAAGLPSVDGGPPAGEVDDTVLAAVALLQAPVATPNSTLPFLRALVAEALERARHVPPARAVRPPRWWILATAAGALGIPIVGTMRSKTRSAVSAVASGAGQMMSPATAGGPVIQLPAVILEAEREEAANAIRLAEKNGDIELARLAKDLQRLMTELTTEGGLDARTAVARLGGLMTNVQDAATPAKTADKADAVAARQASGSVAIGAGGVDVGAPLSAAAPSTDSPPDHAPGAGVHSRRLDPSENRAGATAATDNQWPATGSARGDERRHLEQLKRDAETDTAHCQNNPQACRVGAGATARAHAPSHSDRLAATADARQRVAEAVRQLAERIRRSTKDGEKEGETLRRFARAARGVSEPTTGVAGGRAGAILSNDDQHGDTGEEEQTTDSGGEADVTANGQQRSQTGATARAAAAAGIGTEPGGPVLGPRAVGTGRGGRDVQAPVPNGGVGPSRSQIIGGAASGGFATAAYRRVFADYRAAVEESLDVTAVPGERRFLVRRYFQLIRPRTGL